jgi:hypothetical protein
MNFVELHTRLEARQHDFLDGLLGHMTISFDGKTMLRAISDLEVTIQGTRHKMAGSSEAYSYRVIAKDPDSYAILTKGDHGRDRILHIHFTSRDVFWLYSEETDYGLRDLNYREYFRRVP